MLRVHDGRRRARWRPGVHRDAAAGLRLPAVTLTARRPLGQEARPLPAACAAAAHRCPSNRPSRTPPPFVCDPPPCAAAPRQVGVKVPLIVRLEGTNVERGKEILRTSGLDLITARWVWLDG